MRLESLHAASCSGRTKATTTGTEAATTINSKRFLYLLPGVVVVAAVAVAAVAVVGSALTPYSPEP